MSEKECFIYLLLLIKFKLLGVSLAHSFNSNFTNSSIGQHCDIWFLSQLIDMYIKI